jgi:hypothetical protein
MQAETGKYGYKPPTTKPACIKLLNKLYDALHPVEDESASSSASEASSDSSASSKGSKGKGKEAKAKPKKPRASNASMASAGEFLAESDEEELGLEAGSETAVEPPGFADRMRKAVLDDPELYGKILLYHVRSPAWRSQAC